MIIGSYHLWVTPNPLFTGLAREVSICIGSYDPNDRVALIGSDDLMIIRSYGQIEKSVDRRAA